MAEMTQITPFLLCADFEAELSFFENTLGFTVGFKSEEPDYAFLRRDNVALRILKAGDDVDWLDHKDKQMVYIDVDDVDGLYAEMKPALDKLPKDRVNPPFDRFYGQREFHVRDEGPYLLMFGQGIST
ncbi:VOC family protein [uncultured Litoreibacter sp.]|uniref:bleomycin resistance protein n=1 Tax=uncultured Litoreibacter sp. TaxID=1392394 RepID=UPI002622CEEB|nr:VOC family protein [uncultured Litoreibacter sp.]